MIFPSVFTRVGCCRWPDSKMFKRCELVAFKRIWPNAAFTSVVGKSSALRSSHAAVVAWS